MKATQPTSRQIQPKSIETLKPLADGLYVRLEPGKNVIAPVT